MSDYTINDDGHLLDVEGNEVIIAESPVVVGNARTQDQMNVTIQERLARQNKQIETLKQQAEKTPELHKVIEEMQDERLQLEKKIEQANTLAAEKVANQIKTATEKASQAEGLLQSERDARVRDQATNLILSNVGDRFINPALDVIPRMLANHKREPVMDEKTGKPVEGSFRDLFNVEVVSRDGKTSESQLLEVDDALNAIAANPKYQHHVKGTDKGGSGGGAYKRGRPHITKLSQLKTAADKSAFVTEHGLEEFKKLDQRN